MVITFLFNKYKITFRFNETLHFNIFSVILGVTSTGQLKDEGGVDLFSKVYKGQKGGLNMAFFCTLWMLP